MKRRMVIDLERRAPGCAIVQAGYGIECNDLLAHFDTWITMPNDNMRIIEADVEDFLRLAREDRKVPS